jgi:hypothetical protein
VLLGVLVAQGLSTALRTRITSQIASLPAVPLVLVLAIALVATDVFGPEGVPPFLYGGL